MYRTRGLRRGSGLPGGGNVSGTSLERQFECLRCVVFDWAGTTVDFGCQAPVQAFVESFAAFGVPVTADEAREPMGMPMVQACHRAALANRYLGLFAQPTPAFGVADLLPFLPQALEAALRADLA